MNFNAAPRGADQQSDGEKKVSYIKIKLVGHQVQTGKGWAPKVKVAAGDLKLTKVLDGKSGYLSTSDLPLYFWSGTATRIDSIEVLWPSGTKQSVAHADRTESLKLLKAPQATEDSGEEVG